MSVVSYRNYGCSYPLSVVVPYQIVSKPSKIDDVSSRNSARLRNLFLSTPYGVAACRVKMEELTSGACETLSEREDLA